MENILEAEALKFAYISEDETYHFALNGIDLEIKEGELDVYKRQVMNPNDHPHGGGEGKSPIGRPGPVSPWGVPALGKKTRKHKNQSNKFIVRRRNGK